MHHKKECHLVGADECDVGFGRQNRSIFFTLVFQLSSISFRYVIGSFIEDYLHLLICCDSAICRTLQSVSS
jgi:hypothetical protein